jgi:hypothetical protein
MKVEGGREIEGNIIEIMPVPLKDCTAGRGLSFNINKVTNIVEGKYIYERKQKGGSRIYSGEENRRTSKLDLAIDEIYEQFTVT